MQFTMRQTDDLLKLFVSQMTHVTTHLALLEFEIAQLKAAQGGGASKPNGADKENLTGASQPRGSPAGPAASSATTTRCRRPIRLK